MASPSLSPTMTPQPMDHEPQSSRFIWRVHNFSKIKMKILCSESFSIGDYNWNLLLFKDQTSVVNLSVFLVLADSSKLKDGIKINTQFSLAVVNEKNSDFTVRKDTHHLFHQFEREWGFKHLLSLDLLSDSSTGFLQNDTLVVEADVAVHYTIHCASKMETGYIGLKKRGDHSYLNCILQSLHHIPYFRKVLYQVPETEDDNSFTLALQFLFYKIQCNNTSVSTKELIKSSDDNLGNFICLRNLLEKLDEKLKGTAVEGAIPELFQGHMSYIDCTIEDYTSTKKFFWDIDLDVKDCKNVYASFDKHVEGLDAKKVLFIDFPPVLCLHLKRFVKEFEDKIDDRYEYPLVLDLDRENGKYLSPDADRSVQNLYHLHSVLVHGGHAHLYHVFIRPTLSGQWYKFDDEKVTKEDEKWALEEQYGGEEEEILQDRLLKVKKFRNAVMLVYIRESDKDKIICDVDEKDISEHLRLRLRKEREEKEAKRRCKAKAHLYADIKVALDKDMKEQVGNNIYFDLVDHDKVHNFRVEKQMIISQFKDEVKREFGIQGTCWIWIWSKRQNNTYRADRRLTLGEEEQTVEALSEVSSYAQNAVLKLYLEVEELHKWPPKDRTDQIKLLFFKLYDPEKEELRYVGKLLVDCLRPVDKLRKKLNKLAGFAPNEELLFYEEIKFEPNVICERIDGKRSFQHNNLADGDIICFQKQPPTSSTRFPDVPLFLKYVKNSQTVYFRALEKPEEDGFSLLLMKNHTYDEVVESVCSYLHLDDAMTVRLIAHNNIIKEPEINLKCRHADHLKDMLFSAGEYDTNILYYEVLKTQEVPEAKKRKSLF